MEVQAVADSGDEAGLVETLYTVIARVEGGVVEVHPVCYVLEVELVGNRWISPGMRAVI